MLRMGWQPGRGLGASVEGAKEHVKVHIKTDAKGLGHQKGQVDQPTGLDVFQRILGKLNGNEQEVEAQIEKKERLSSGLYMHFVPGGVLEGTVKSKKEMKHARKQAEKQKRKAEKQAEKQAEMSQKERKKLTKTDNAGETGISVTSEPSDSSPAETPRPVVKARGIRATRNRYIAMKRQATSDSQSLKEILML